MWFVTCSHPYLKKKGSASDITGVLWEIYDVLGVHVALNGVCVYKKKEKKEVIFGLYFTLHIFALS